MPVSTPDEKGTNDLRTPFPWGLLTAEPRGHRQGKMPNISRYHIPECTG